MKRFQWRNAVRIVIGAVLAVMVYGALLVWVPYQREQRIAKFEALEGGVESQYAGPEWLPKSIRDRVTIFNRATTLLLQKSQITDANLEHLKGLPHLKELLLHNTQISDAGLMHLKWLTNLEWLSLGDTQITDAGLEHLKGLTKLTDLDLSNTKITDTGLEHLKGLTNLAKLFLTNTQVTEGGREMLRKALPHCDITSDP